MPQNGEYMPTYVFSIGGSILCPNGPSESFVDSLSHIIQESLKDGIRVVLVVGGGSIARDFQNTLTNIHPECDTQALDYIGIEATRVNASLLAGVLKAPLPVPRSPEELPSLSQQCIVMGGWKPGFSTDMVSVCAAEVLGVNQVFNFTNVDYVYDKDPQIHPDAKAITQMSWEEYATLFSVDQWKPGMHAPFDPIAARKARELSMKIWIANAENPDIIRNIISGKINRNMIGTVIG